MLKAENFAPQTEDKEIAPWYTCGCCHDTGLIASRYIHNFVANYNGNTSKHFICRRAGCEHGKKYDNAYWMGDDLREKAAKERGGYALSMRQYQNIFDYRLDPRICEEIHTLEYETWLNWVDDQVANKQKAAIALTGIGQMFGAMPKADE
jgi:hypothetical protein